MKLNKRGWGLAEMMLITSLLFILLLVASYFIYSFYNSLDGKDVKEYYLLESKIKVAAVRYSTELHEEKGIVTLDKLKMLGYITSFNDSEENPCDGYVLFSDDVFDSYIKCNNFTSQNFDNKLLTNK